MYRSNGFEELTRCSVDEGIRRMKVLGLLFNLSLNWGHLSQQTYFVLASPETTTVFPSSSPCSLAEITTVFISFSPCCPLLNLHICYCLVICQNGGIFSSALAAKPAHWHLGFSIFFRMPIPTERFPFPIAQLSAADYFLCLPVSPYLSVCHYYHYRLVQFFEKNWIVLNFNATVFLSCLFGCVGFLFVCLLLLL